MKSYQHICDYERYDIWQAPRQGQSQDHIAKALGRHSSTICRELKRNTYSRCHLYTYHWAKNIVKDRKQDANQRKHRKLTDELAPVIEQLIRHYVGLADKSRMS